LPFCQWTITAPIGKPGYPKHIKHLGDQIRARRIELGLPQHDVADRLGVERDTLRNWEKGRTMPEVKFLPAIIAFLGYNPLSEARTSGKQVRRVRLALGLSQLQLAHRAGVDPATVQRLETDTKGMARRSAARVYDALGL
jgi:transcriptional regulator with XRE-family HTH domain